MDPIITSAITSFVTTIATNGSKVPMQTLDDLWYLAFGKINHIAELKKAKHEVETAHYKDLVAQKILKINENNLQEPPMSVVGPALEASRYYIEEEKLREMFASVIAASMDKTKSKNVHHAFVEIIKQISPDDAKNLTFFKVRNNHPIVQFKSVHLNGKGYLLLKTNVFLGHYTDIITGNENAASITNLHRLGLVSISYEENYSEKHNYTTFRDSTFYKNVSNHQDPEVTRIEMQEGIIRITPLGQSFINVCL
ncbi:hypothetical protein BKP37_12675 [Anaerobacillus alkalilacustris]|uniref:DUF4393 domain-containing protein n=1 Tax=Anaerobacillus alkalilacustris TaxID=393763 RepID=A0A1S2LJG4_9BACI|nr:DUF4393 domain-containing protein [Anaerobacillus alkalilacustris]OIJ12652.1 hypothetical protein BKP37_12675 [Anaerobacillus alkalilacustris]